jgi:cytochrome d ubiquinol oxidase subunit I
MGRQPWVVYGLMRTSDAVSPGVTTTDIVISLSVFTLLYAVLAVVEVRLMARYAAAGPVTSEHPPPPVTLSGLTGRLAAAGSPSPESAVEAGGTARAGDPAPGGGVSPGGTPVPDADRADAESDKPMIFAY